MILIDGSASIKSNNIIDVRRRHQRLFYGNLEVQAAAIGRLTL